MDINNSKTNGTSEMKTAGKATLDLIHNNEMRWICQIEDINAWPRGCKIKWHEYTN